MWKSLLVVARRREVENLNCSGCDLLLFFCDRFQEPANLIGGASLNRGRTLEVDAQ
jgi:hypothetical protein